MKDPILSLLHALSDSAQREGRMKEADHYCDMILDMAGYGTMVIPVTMYFADPTHYCKDGKVMRHDFNPGTY